MDRILNDFIDRLSAIKSLAEARSVTLGLFESLGYPEILFGYLPCPSLRAPQLPDLLVSERLRKLWREHSTDLQFCIPEAVKLKIHRQTRPFFWATKQRPAGLPSGSIERDQWVWGDGERSLGALDIESVFVVPLRTTIAHVSGAFFVGSQMLPDEFADHMHEHGQTLWLASLVTHECMCQAKANELIEKIRLSKREKECLKWLSLGLRNDRIAERMSITLPTVDLHIANARRKLSAKTREQALVQAISIGLVSPIPEQPARRSA